MINDKKRNKKNDRKINYQSNQVKSIWHDCGGGVGNVYDDRSFVRLFFRC